MCGAGMPSVSVLFTQWAEIGAQEGSVALDVLPFAVPSLTLGRLILVMFRRRIILKVVNLELLA